MWLIFSPSGPVWWPQWVIPFIFKQRMSQMALWQAAWPSRAWMMLLPAHTILKMLLGCIVLAWCEWGVTASRPTSRRTCSKTWVLLDATKLWSGSLSATAHRGRVKLFLHHPPTHARTLDFWSVCASYFMPFVSTVLCIYCLHLSHTVVYCSLIQCSIVCVLCCTLALKKRSFVPVYMAK